MTGTMEDEASRPLKTSPPGARQHVTAGPYSPVLEVDARHLVVISGQVAVDPDGRTRGETIEEQTRVTLLNCAAHLGTARCGLQDVFKVNVYLANLDHWVRFNAVYEQMMPEPRPVRTAIQAVLLPEYLVEIEMWAAKSKG